MSKVRLGVSPMKQKARPKHGLLAEIDVWAEFWGFDKDDQRIKHLKSLVGKDKTRLARELKRMKDDSWTRYWDDYRVAMDHAIATVTDGR